ncbi:hypothetical protein GCM10027610_098560 [Dactylosporangium cerinum]
MLLGHGGELAEEVAGRGEMVTVSVEPVGGSGGQGRGARHGVQIGGRLEVCRDPSGREDVQQMLTDTRVNVSDDRIFLRYQAVVAPAAPRPTPGTACPSPRPTPRRPGPPRKNR